MDINLTSQIFVYTDLASFPVTGAAKTLYVADDTEKLYRWTGSAYVEVSAGSISTAWGTITGTLSNQTDLQTALNNKEPLKGVDDNYVTDAQLVVISNTSGTNSGDNATNTTSNTYADGKVSQVITNGITDKAPSEDAVFDALALKQDKVSGVDDTEIGYLNGVTSSIQTQLNNTMNGASLYGAKFSGQWWFAPGSGARASVGGLQGNIWLVPIFIERDTIVTDIGVLVQTGSASQNVRVAVYKGDNTNGRPKTLVIDSGNLAADTNGFKSVTLGSPITLLGSDKIYWLGMQCSNSTLALYYNTLISNNLTTTAAANSSAHILAQAFGAFPADVSSAAYTTNVLNWSIPLKIQ